VTSTTFSTCAFRDLECEPSRVWRVQAVGDRHRTQLDALAGRERRLQRVRALGLHADHACATGAATAMPRDEAAPADRDDDRLDLGHVLEDLEADRALTRDRDGSSKGWMSVRPVSSSRASSRSNASRGSSDSRSTDAP
jgi:hypothetical protein